MHLIEMERTDRKILAKKEFDSEVSRDTIYGTIDSYGKCHNEAILEEGTKYLFVEWFVSSNGEDIDYADICLELVGKKVVDYDGVFDLPKEIVEMLDEYGLDTSEI
jgi:hypothetical protein